MNLCFSVVNPINPSFAFLDGLGGLEMLVIFVLALMLFGGKRLPEVAKGLGKSIREFKRAASGVEDEIRRAMDLDHSPHRRPPVRRPRSAVTTAKDPGNPALPAPYQPPPSAATGTTATAAAAAAATSSETPDDLPPPPAQESGDESAESEDPPKTDPK